MELDNQLAHPKYIIECPIDSWRVFGSIDDTNVWTCRPGSGPGGKIEMDWVNLDNNLQILLSEHFTGKVSFILRCFNDIFSLNPFLFFSSGYMKAHCLKYQTKDCMRERPISLC